MTKRTCDVCGKRKPRKGGKTCEKGHFVCADHITSWFPSRSRKSCPLDNTRLK